MKKNYYACVYGGANEKISDKYKNKVKELGKIIVKNGFSLVYGAGASGCMGAVADGIREENGFILGVSPTFISEFEDIFDCDNRIMVDTMSERKIIMEKYADIFIIVPGGIGTMDEFFQVLTLKYLRRINIPIIVINIDGFYDSLLNLIDDLVNQGAVVKDIYSMFDVADDVNSEIITKLLKKIKAN